MKANFFKDIAKLFDNEPINEMGLVALFCVMFQSLRATQFQWRNELISFMTIKYVRSEFPDACLRCKVVNKRTNIELNVEFEFYSYNYIRHNHPIDKDKCDLIICWEENAKKDYRVKNQDIVKRMPPVLSLKDCFDTGEIVLHV